MRVYPKQWRICKSHLEMDDEQGYPHFRKPRKPPYAWRVRFFFQPWALYWTPRCLMLWPVRPEQGDASDRRLKEPCISQIFHGKFAYIHSTPYIFAKCRVHTYTTWDMAMVECLFPANSGSRLKQDTWSMRILRPKLSETPRNDFEHLWNNFENLWNMIKHCYMQWIDRFSQVSLKHPIS